MSARAWKRRGSAIQSPKPSFYEDATYYVDGDSFFEAVKDSDEESPKNAVVAVEDGRLPASILDFAEEHGYAFHYIMSDGSEVGVKKTPPKKEFDVGVLL
jgi:hypothetical protein